MKLPRFKGCKVPSRFFRPTVQTLKTGNGLPDIDILYHRDLGCWEILTRLVVVIPVVKNGRKRYVTVVVEPGFLTDFASVPKLFWFLINPFELGYIAPIIHDKIYRTEELRVLVGSRAVADKAMLHIMVMERVVRWRRVSAYHALRVFGDRW